jgi:hypothetical protein
MTSYTKIILFVLLTLPLAFGQSVVIGSGVNVGDVNAQTGTSYTVVASDQGKLVTFNNASAVAVTLPQATGQFGAGWFVAVRNYGAGTVTITPTTSTIDSGASVTVATDAHCFIYSDGTNYKTTKCAAAGGGGGTASGFYLDISGTKYIPQNMFAATLPSAGTYAWVNQASATETAVNSGLVLTDPASDANTWKIRTASIGGNTTLIAAVICHMTETGSTFPACGVGFRESATGKLVLIGISNASGIPNIVAQNWDSATVFGSTITSELLFTPPTVSYFKIVYNGTNVTFSWSADGATWKQFLSESKTTHFTTAPDQFWYGINGGNDGLQQSVTLLSWGVS